MAYKPSLRRLHRKCLLPQQGQRPAIERYQSVEMGPSQESRRRRDVFRYSVKTVCTLRLSGRCWSQITTKWHLFPGASGFTSEDHRWSHFPLRRQLSYYLLAGRNWLREFVSPFVTLVPWLSVRLPGSRMSALISPRWKFVDRRANQ